MLCAVQAGAIVLVDNSILAPVFQQPLSLGADICMTSATKFLGGHSDITGGILSVRGKELAQRVYFTQNAEGAILGPFDCWLCLRGLKVSAMCYFAWSRAELLKLSPTHPTQLIQLLLAD